MHINNIPVVIQLFPYRFPESLHSLQNAPGLESLSAELPTQDGRVARVVPIALLVRVRMANPTAPGARAAFRCTVINAEDTALAAKTPRSSAALGAISRRTPRPHAGPNNTATPTSHAWLMCKELERLKVTRDDRTSTMSAR